MSCDIICYQLADAVKFMHKANLLHNDIKTKNVLLKGELNVGTNFDWYG